MNKLKIVIVLFLFVAVNFGCNAQDVNLPTISTKQLKEQMKTNKDLVILDVRTPQELNGPLGHIEGVVNIPLQELDKRVGELDKYKDKEIAVICRTGHRSSIASKILIKDGFKIENVAGGMTQYRKDETKQIKSN